MRIHRFAPLLIATTTTLPHRSAAAQTPPPADERRPPPRTVLSLAQAERAALQSQPQVLAARAQTQIAEGAAEQTRAPLYPQITATAQYQRSTGNFAPRPGAIPGGTGSQPSASLNPAYDVWNFGATANQLIYDFGQTTGKYRAASATVEAQRTSEQTARVQVIFGVRRAYFAARAQKELVDVAHESLDDQLKHLLQVPGLVQVGTQPAIALATQQAAVANARVQVIVAENNYQTAKAQLNQAVGLQGGTDYDVGNEVMNPVDEEDQALEPLVAKAIAARPELVSLLRQRESQEATLRSARGEYGPTLAATAAASEAGIAIDGLVPNWNVGLLLSWPIFQGGLTLGQIHQAQGGLESIDAQKALEELQIRLDVDTARLAVLAAKATISASEDAVASAREQRRLAEQRYATGVGNIIELTDAQVAYTTALAQVVQARYQLATARAQLLAALGRT